MSVSVRVSVAVKRHYDYGSSDKGEHLIEVEDYSSVIWSIIMAGSIVACNRHKTGNILIRKQQEMNCLSY